MDTVRLQAFSNITGVPRDVLRNRQKPHNQHQNPWDEPTSPGERRYDGFHALCAVVQSDLTAKGMGIAAAAELIRYNEHVIRRFLANATKAETLDLYVASIKVPITGRFGAEWETAPVNLNTSDAIIAAFSAAMGAVGSKFGDGVAVSGPVAAVSSLRGCYGVLSRQAEAVGYVIKGFKVFKIDTADDEGADE